MCLCVAFRKTIAYCDKFIYLIYSKKKAKKINISAMRAVDIHETDFLLEFDKNRGKGRKNKKRDDLRLLDTPRKPKRPKD